MGRSKKKLNNSPPRYYPIVGAAVIERLTKHDVCLGRGQKIVRLEGNANFRQVIHAHKNAYTRAGSDIVKREVATNVVKVIESLDPPGRFYEILPDETLQTVSFDRALAKTMQALREKRGPGALPPLFIQQDCEVPPVVENKQRSAKRAPAKKAQVAKPKKRLKIRIKTVSKETRSYAVKSPPDENILSTPPEPVEGLLGIPAARVDENELMKNFDEDQTCIIDKTARAVAQGGRLQQLVESALAITTETNPSTLDETFSLVPPALTVFASGMYSSSTLDNMGPDPLFRGRSGAVSKEKIIQNMAGQQNQLDSMDDIVDLVDHTIKALNRYGPLLRHQDPILPFAILPQPACKLGMDTLPFVQPPLLQATNSLFLDDDDFNDSYYPTVQNLEQTERVPIAQVVAPRCHSPVSHPINVVFPPSGNYSASYHPSIGKTSSVIAQIYRQTNWNTALLDSPGMVMDVVEPPELHRAKHSLFLDEQNDRQDTDRAESFGTSTFEDTFSMNSFDGI